jgi:hypothetical protein
MPDARGRITTKRLELAAQADLVAYLAVVDTVMTALESVTDLGVSRCDLVITAVDAGFAAVANSNIDVGATFSGYTTDGNGKKASFKLPGIKDALVSDDGTVPITGDIATFLANFEAAGDCLISDGETIDSWIKGVLDK